MNRIFPDHTYGDGPRAGCWWDETCDLVPALALREDMVVDVAVIGAGITGLSAAMHLAQAGASVVVLEAKTVGWGASGRNGGFCCLGGGMAEDAELDKKYGRQERLAYRATELAAVDFVRSFLADQNIDADVHSDGETVLAHRPKDMTSLRSHAASIRENYGVEPILFGAQDLQLRGMNGPFHGGLTVPLGFGLNPRKYLSGLYQAALAAGASVFEKTPASDLRKAAQTYQVVTPKASVRASKVVFATNGYSSETDALAGKYMPAQSSVLVTRPMSQSELEAQGWRTDQMCYDTRHLLHYFRLMPDGRFLFGMRGGLLGGEWAEARSRQRLERHFRRMFPAWRDVEITNAWSGLVALSRKKLPFVGVLTESPALFGALCFHGNGVAMGSYSGKLIADTILETRAAEIPLAMRVPMLKFPIGKSRRLLMPPLYAYRATLDT